MSTSTDGVPPSVTPGPDGGPDDRALGADQYEDDDASDSGSAWLREEIQRRMAAARSGSGGSGSGGRHARHEAAEPSTSAGYVPRHSVATPGPGAPPPHSVVAPRRGERRPAGPDAWSGPREPADGGNGRSDPVHEQPGPQANGGGGPRNSSLFVLPGPARQDTAPEAPGQGPAGGGSVRFNPPDLADPAAPARSGDPLFTARTPPPSGRARQANGTPLDVDGTPEDGADPEAADLDPDDLDGQGKRVRVVLAERKGVARPVRTVVDIQEDTGVGELLRSNLIGSQLAVALRFAVGAGFTLAVLPLLFYLFPELGRINVLGLRLPWLVLGVLVYPFLLGLGLWHTRTAERVEQNFADHVQD